MSLVYRTAGPWGPGKGSDLAPTEVDNNFWQVVQSVAAKAEQGVGISHFLVDGDQMTVVLTDATMVGPYTLPTTPISFVGTWMPSHAYLVNQIFTYGGSTYIVTFNHTSATTFDAGANDGAGNDYYAVLLSNPAGALPTGGATGSVLTKGSTVDFVTLWSLPTLAALTDVDQTASPATGQVVYWDGSVFSYKDESGGGGGGTPPALEDLTDVNVVGVHGAVLTYDINNSWWTQKAKIDYQTITGSSTTLALTDINTFFNCTFAGTSTVTLPALATVAFPVGDGGIHFWFRQSTALGQVVLAGASGVTLQTPAGRLPKSRAIGSVIHLSSTFTSNTWNVDGDLAYDGAFSAYGTVSGANSLDPTPNDCDLYSFTPTGNTTLTISPVPAMKRLTLVVTTSGTTSFTVTFSTGFKAQGTLATGTVTGKVFTVNFIGDGTTFFETSRTTAM